MKTISFYCMMLACILLPLISCKKIFGEPKLPPITQEGKNTFGCMVNGTLFYPKGAVFGVNDKSISNIGDKFKVIKQHKSIYITIEFTASNSGSATYCIGFKDTNNPCNYELCNTSEGKVEISKLDTQNKIISGTFSAFLKGSDGCSDITITNGRFDFKYN